MDGVTQCQPICPPLIHGALPAHGARPIPKGKAHIGGDLTLRYAPAPKMRVEATFGVVVQAGEVAYRPSVLARFDLGRHARVSITGGYLGSPQYQQLRGDLSLSWNF